VAVGALVAAAPAPAGAKVTIGGSIAGIRPGLTVKQVHQRIGKPSRTLRDHGRVTHLFYGRRSLRMTVDFDGSGHVANVLTIAAGQRTRQGIGVNSTVQTVRRVYPAAQCTASSCLIRGRTVTEFTIARGRVISIALHR
jgi:hypothetical protein